MSETYENWLSQAGYGEIAGLETVSGGCINEARRLCLDNGTTLFLKTNPQTPTDMFIAEAAGLSALASSGSLRIPAVVHASEQFILLEDLGSARPGASYWTELGAGLARIHGHKVENFGFIRDNYCGATPQKNQLSSNGIEFFAHQRILALAIQCFDKGLIPSETITQIDHIAEHLSSWIPDLPPVLIHGDLWSGNVHCCGNGEPALVDPAAYWGWAEAELAMTQLFGEFPAEFYNSYADNSELAADWKERIPLYNLYHLLNHLLLFGSSYLPAVAQIAERFGNKVR